MKKVTYEGRRRWWSNMCLSLASQESLAKANICSCFLLGFLECLQTLIKQKNMCITKWFLKDTSEGSTYEGRKELMKHTCIGPGRQFWPQPNSLRGPAMMDRSHKLSLTLWGVRSLRLRQLKGIGGHAYIGLVDSFYPSQTLFRGPAKLCLAVWGELARWT